MPLEEAIQAALKNNRQVQAALLDGAKAQPATAEPGASRYPKINTMILSGASLNPMPFTIPQGSIGTVPGIGPLPAADTNYSARLRC